MDGFAGIWLLDVHDIGETVTKERAFAKAG